MNETHAKIVALLKEPEIYQDMLDANKIIMLAHAGKIDESLDMVKALSGRVYSDGYKGKLEERIRLIQASAAGAL